jgi:hypothetical protein
MPRGRSLDRKHRRHVVAVRAGSCQRNEDCPAGPPSNSPLSARSTRCRNLDKVHISIIGFASICANCDSQAGTLQGLLCTCYRCVGLWSTVFQLRSGRKYRSGRRPRRAALLDCRNAIPALRGDERLESKLSLIDVPSPRSFRASRRGRPRPPDL